MQRLHNPSYATGNLPCGCKMGRLLLGEAKPWPGWGGADQTCFSCRLALIKAQADLALLCYSLSDQVEDLTEIWR